VEGGGVGGMRARRKGDGPKSFKGDKGVRCNEEKCRAHAVKNGGNNISYVCA